MANKCKAALITCEDFRLHQRPDGRNYIAEFIGDLGEDCDLITRGGGVQDLVRPKTEGHSNSLYRDTRVSIKLHNAETIYLVNHEQCGAYREMDFSSREEEMGRHHKDLRKARKMILDRFPEKDVKLFFAKLVKGNTDKFEINPVE